MPRTILTDEDFDNAFEETMMYFKRTQKLDDKTLDDVLPSVLGHFEAALKDKFPTEKFIKRFAN